MSPLVVCVVSCALGAAHRMHGNAIGWQARRDATRREFDSIWPGVRRAVRCRVPHQSSSEPCAERAELPSCAQPSAAPLDATLRRARVAVQLYALCRCERQYRGLQI